MDTLEFRRMAIFHDNFGEHIHAEIIINGIPFSIIAEENERLAAEKGTGKYKGFEYTYEYACVLYKYLFENEICDENPEQKPIMICSGCHEAGCWGLYVSIEESDTEVIWRNINNYHMLKGSPGSNWWDYSVFPSFRFSKENYNTALEQLKIIAREPNKGWY